MRGVVQKTQLQLHKDKTNKQTNNATSKYPQAPDSWFRMSHICTGIPLNFPKPHTSLSGVLWMGIAMLMFHPQSLGGTFDWSDMVHCGKQPWALPSSIMPPAQCFRAFNGRKYFRNGLSLVQWHVSRKHKWSKWVWCAQCSISYRLLVTLGCKN